ncbi:MAG TPA: APC family permease, partial [Legionellaceae bacterium]|nr:APC family permease [Legionellaceae bacterium]
IKFILPTIAIITLLHHAGDLSNVSIHLSSGEDWIGVLSALSAGGVAFAFTGFQNGLILAGEVKNPQRNIPIGILGAVLIGFMLYFMLELSFIAAMPQKYLVHGWHDLHYPGDSGPLVGLTLLVGLGWVATILMIDAAFSPFGTTLVYTAATSRIIYGMALHHHLPKIFLKVNRHKIPYLTLYVNFLVGILSFLPFPGWQKLVAFLSSASILSYGVGPICLLGMRKLQPNLVRPFQLRCSTFISYTSFYMCNLMLYWCGFDILWKLNIALLFGAIFYSIYKKINPLNHSHSLYWFATYMISLLLLSYYGSFAGTGTIKFPLDLLLILPFSLFFLRWSQEILDRENYEYQMSKMDKLTVLFD